MLRVIFFLLLLYLVYSLLKSYNQIPNRRPRRPRERGAGEAEDMVFDPQCRSYVPKKDAIRRGDKFFCSEACARQYLAR